MLGGVARRLSGTRRRSDPCLFHVGLIDVVAIGAILLVVQRPHVTPRDERTRLLTGMRLRGGRKGAEVSRGATRRRQKLAWRQVRVLGIVVLGHGRLHVLHVVIQIRLELIDHLTRVQPQVASVRGKHPLCVATLGNVVEVALFEGNEHLFLEPQHL